MAKVNCGILDGFIGKVGTVIGSFWKGIPVMRAWQRKAKGGNSDSQQLIRARFSALGSLASEFLPVLRMGMAGVASRHRYTEVDAFVSKNWDAAHATVPGSATVDYADLVVAEGNLPKVYFGTPHFDTAQTVEVSFVAGSEASGADPSDSVYLFAYCPDIDEGMLSEAVARSSQRATLTVPSHWNGLTVHVWGLTVGGSLTNKGNVSDSSYVGTGDIS